MIRTGRVISVNRLKTLRILYTKALNNIFSRKKGYQYRKFLIVGLPRSGTTLLHTYLNNHPDIWSHGETDITTFQDPEQIKNLFSPYPANIKAVGAKILLPAGGNFEVERIIKDLDDSEHPPNYIFLYRENLLRWYISLKIAERTHQWSVSDNQKAIPLHLKQIEVDTKNLIQDFNQAQQNIVCYKKLFHKRREMVISYEELVHNPEVKLLEVQEFLGVHPVKLKSLLKKQNPELLPRLVLNFKEVTEVLRRTSYEKFLE